MLNLILLKKVKPTFRFYKKKIRKNHVSDSPANVLFLIYFTFLTEYFQIPQNKYVNCEYKNQTT